MLEKCTDPLDMGSQMQNQANEQAVETARRTEARRVQAVKQALDDGDFDGVHCITCEDEIPQARLDMHHMHCTPCAQAIETNNKRMKR